jgi:uncharacterized protein (DUF1697 family)
MCAKPIISNSNNKQAPAIPGSGGPHPTNQAMETYLAILRGINVSGQKMMPMKELQSLMEGLHLEQVRTYIQSGNVVFQTEATDVKALAEKIAEKIADQFQFQVPVILRTAGELQAALACNPFLQESQPETDKLHVTFLAEKPTQARIDQVMALPCAPDKCHISGREVFLYCPQGYGRTKLNNAFLEKKLGVTATTRNLKTVKQLISMAATAGLEKP